MLFLLYLVVRALARLFVAAGHDAGSKDLEIPVLRQQLRVLQRKTRPRNLRTVDGVLLAAASRIIPRDRWVAVVPPVALFASVLAGLCGATPIGRAGPSDITARGSRTSWEV